LITVRAPSNQKPYDDFWSGDSAFIQPAEDAESIAAHSVKVKRSRETGDWSELVVPGRTPTKFVMQAIKGEQIRWIYDRNRCSDAAKEMGTAIAWALCFRCAIVEVVNLPIEFKVTFVDDPNLGRIADTNIVNLLDAADPSIVTELGLAAFVRARTLNPL
jgi:hypothetical protein